jgi:5'-deoxynucleotidase
MKPLTLYDFLRAGHIKRWHNVNTNREQTVAEHSYMVTLIAVHLAQHMIGDEKFNAAVAFHALFHDSPEVVLGDTPTPAKRFIRDFMGDTGIFDRMENRLMPKVPYFGDLDPEAGRYVKIADRIEAVYWIDENGVGRHAEIVKTTSWRNLEDYVHKLDEERPDDGWYEAVNEVLMALGMRYVHKQSRITPP